MSVRDAPRGQPDYAAAFRAAGPPPPTGARLAEVLAAGERHADATAAPGDGVKNWRKYGSAAMLAAAAGERERAAKAAAAPPKVAEKKWYEKAKDAAGEYAGAKKKEFDSWRADEATRKQALNELRSSALSAGYVRRALGEGDCYRDAAAKARHLYFEYRTAYILGEMKVKEAKKNTLKEDSDALKELYEKYEAAVIRNTDPTDEEKAKKPFGGYNETVSCGFDDDDALLAAEMEAAGTALCCDADADVDTGDALYNGFLPTPVRRAGYMLDPYRRGQHDNIVRELLELKERYQAGEHEVYDRVKTLLRNYRNLHYLPQPKDQHPSTDTQDTRAKSFLNPFGWIEAGFEPGIDQEEVGCGWSAIRGMQYPCAMVFTMIGADGVTRLYCASGKPPSAYDNASQLRPLSNFNSELREMLDEIAGMWPGAPRYTNYVLVPAGQSEPEPEPEPEPSMTTQLRIPISELEGEGGAEKLTGYVMNWLKQMNVKINDDETTNTELNDVTTRRGAVGVPINAGRARKFKDTEDVTRVARQLQAAFRARRDARTRASAGAAAAARAGRGADQ